MSDDISRLKFQLAQAQTAARLSAETAEKACERLLLYEPVVKASRGVVKAFLINDEDLGMRSCGELTAAVAALPPEPS